MFRKWIGMGGLLAALVSVLPIQAQTAGGWYAFLFNGITRQFVRVDASGAAQTFDLGLGEDIFLGSRDIALASDGSRIAYCANSAQAGTPQGDTTLYVLDLNTQTRLVTLPLGANIGCRVTTDGFNADASQVAVGVVKYFPGSTDMDTSGPVWRLVVVDVASGSIVNELNAENPAAANARILVGTALLPEVRYFANNQIIFAEVPYAIGGAPDWNAFIWQVDAGTVQPDSALRWGKSGLSYLETTGELVWLANDPNRPAIDPGGPLPAFNTVRLADKSGTETTVYYTGDWLLVDTAFVNNGAGLAILQQSAFDPENPDQQQSQWVVLGRDGSLTSLASGSGFSQVGASPNGAVLFEFTFNADFTQQTSRLSLLTAGQQAVLWESNEPGWEFAGTTDVPAAAVLPAFPTVQ